MAEEEAQASFRIDADHPCLAGHFPGNPIVPGVVLLDELLEAIGSATVAPTIMKIASVKFLMTVKAGEKVDLFWTREGQRVRFQMKAGATAVATGSLTLESADAIDP